MALQMEPITTTIEGAADMTGWSRSEVYRRLAAGDIEAKRSGGRTLPVVASVRAYINALPRATFGAAKVAAAA
jgi:hypothetical protein